jgi:sporulation protein YlmC with PRC-barrel domain
MAQQSQFAIGTKASCTDGPCGEVRRIVVDPTTTTVTHLVIEPRHRAKDARLVPVDLVTAATAGEVTLRCTIAEFDRLDAAEERDPVEGRGEGTVDLVAPPPAWTPRLARIVVQDVVPVGEVLVSPGDRVDALDGEIGQVHGFLVDPDDQHVTYLLLREGHFLGRREVAIPAGAVTPAEGAVRVNLTKKQIEDLPHPD